ncbi:MAG TPA: hypothetical protein VFF03_15195, partial [Rhodocyclaceae bacterium]|nr:hypothetical protein [Rhodocyclaceae bacterium]
MRRLKQLIFGGSGSARASLSGDVRAALESWRLQPGADLDQPHFHTRYVVVDVATAGLDSDRDALLGVAGLGLGRGGIILPDDAFALDLPTSGEGDGELLDRQLTA